MCLSHLLRFLPSKFEAIRSLADPVSGFIPDRVKLRLISAHKKIIFWATIMHSPLSFASIINHQSSVIHPQSFIINYSFRYTLYFMIANHFDTWMAVFGFFFYFLFQISMIPIPHPSSFPFIPPWTVTNPLNFNVSSPLSSLTSLPFILLVVLIPSPIFIPISSTHQPPSLSMRRSWFTRIWMRECALFGKIEESSVS